MADSTALGDLLAGAAGKPVDRPGLEAFVANSQSMNGLRSAQTDEALLNAQNTIREQQAQDGLEGNLTDMYTSQGQPYAQAASMAKGMGAIMKSHFGTYQQAAAGGVDMMKQMAQGQVMSPTATPQQRFQADQVLNPGASAGEQLGDGQIADRFAPLGPNGEVPVQQTPVSQSVVGKNNADASLATAQANQPQLFHPSAAAGVLDPASIQSRAQGIANGQYPPPSQYEWTKNPKGASAVMSAVTALNPNFTQSLQPQIASTIKDFAGGGKNGQALQGYRTVDAHINLLTDAAAALQNGDVQGLNAIKNHVSTFFGETAPVDANMLPQFIATEAMRALARNSIGAQADRDDAQQKINVMNQSPQQQTEAISALKKILNGGKSSLEASYNAGTMGLAGHPGTPTFDEIYSGNFHATPTPGAGGDAATPPQGAVLNYDPASGTFK